MHDTVTMGAENRANFWVISTLGGVYLRRILTNLMIERCLLKGCWTLAEGMGVVGELWVELLMKPLVELR
ncbi:hypothetical protein BLI708_04115 [Bifidobacterium imperatoris]|uniref:Uncharacterized protein n=1 Tax=Bifidobacterium imperatoris TaxID=2020965 RepID=A0ABX7S3Y1_9BIFI|nr:hypothetical protein [Bifidobacterium imperatoris]QSY58469.1 hypothetical protein BLI708_04115 [Bifidobacterium imperatoris]